MLSIVANCQVALHLIPDRDFFIQLLMGSCHDPEDFGGDVIILVSIVQPLLEEINAISVSVPHYPHVHFVNNSAIALREIYVFAEVVHG